MNKVTKKIILSGVFVVVLVSALYIYNVKLQSDEEATLSEILIPAETRQNRRHFDIVERSKLRWKDAITIRGWVSKENVNQDPREMYLVLKSKNSSFIYKIDQANLSRPDVTRSFKLDSSINNHGFVLTFPVKELKGGAYKLGFVIDDKTGKYFVSANSLLTIPEDNDVPLMVEKKIEPRTISKQVALSLNEKTRELTHYFDKIDKSDEYITVTGWAYLNGMDATSSTTYVLLKKDKNVSVFDVKIRERKDVTKVFAKDNLDLDSSGFMASIPVETLEKGKYQLGLYIANGNQAGILYSNKYVDIEK